jgi:NodT family efflux transporter outer membrane factor (OMF) lipoprotein
MLALLLLLLGGCMVGPDYNTPPISVGDGYKENPGWSLAQPDRAALPKGQWWAVFKDPELDLLMQTLNASNQNIAVAQAKYQQAQALLAGTRAPLFPTIGLTGSLNRSAGSATAPSGVVTTTATDVYGVNVSASWMLDIWGAVRRNIESQNATTEAVAADLGGAQLTSQTSLALTYIQLRILDARRRLLANTLAAYERALKLTQNKYEAGVSGKADVAVATTQLESTRAQLIDTDQQRAVYEHAIAVLLGQPPATFSLAANELKLGFPEVPVALPSQLLEQRPDVAAAQRRTAAANAQIGVATAAWFPSLTLSSNGGYRSNDYLQWFSAPAQFWSLGSALAETIFDGGSRQALVDQNNAAYLAQAAAYRQIVLQALQQVEDAMVQVRVYEQEAVVQQRAVASARESVTLVMNQYNAGLVDYLSVAVLEATALNNETTYLSLIGNRLAATVQLIAALGGGWTLSEVAQPVMGQVLKR